VDWLPGTDLPLTEDQLHQAFFDGMPTIWKEQYKNASCSVCNTTRADLLRFFHMQQEAADHSQRAIKLKQRQESQTCSFCNSDCTVTQFHKKTTRMMISIGSRSLRMEARVQDIFLMALSAQSILMQAMLGQVLC
jgi:hypothetical protein